MRWFVPRVARLSASQFARPPTMKCSVSLRAERSTSTSARSLTAVVVRGSPPPPLYNVMVSFVSVWLPQKPLFVNKQYAAVANYAAPAIHWNKATLIVRGSSNQSLSLLRVPRTRSFPTPCSHVLCPAEFQLAAVPELPRKLSHEVGALLAGKRHECRRAICSFLRKQAAKIYGTRLLSTTRKIYGHSSLAPLDREARKVCR